MIMTAPAVPAAPAKVSAPQKPGYATTEFWSAVVAPYLFLLLSQFNVAHIDTNNARVEQYVKLGSYLLAAVGSGFYARSRGHMKAGAAVGVAVSDVLAYLSDLAPGNQTGVMTNLFPAVAGELKAITSEFSDQQRQELASLMEEALGKYLKPKPNPGPTVQAPTGQQQIQVDQPPGDGDTFVAPQF